MDVMEPKLVWVDGVCFRFPDSEIWISKENTTKEKVCEVIEMINPKKRDHVKETIQQDIIKSDAIGTHLHSYYVARRYHPFIVGHKRTMIMEIEEETNTTILMPKKNENYDCVIRGSNDEVIEAAINRINCVISRARMIIDPTHFLSISMNDDTIISNFVKFRADMLNERNSKAKGINETVFVNPKKLHLNLGMLLLVDDKEMKAAFEALAEWKKTMITPLMENKGPIKIKVEGLDYERQFHSLNSFIYAKISSENNVLQSFADQTEQFFVKKGLMIATTNGMKLHMKLMRFPSLANKQTLRTKHKKNCSDFVTAHKDHFFGETVLNAFYLSQRHKYDENQYYATVEKIDLPVV